MSNIFSKELLYKKKAGGNKAYLLCGTTVKDVATLGFTESIDLDKTRGTEKSDVQCNYVILNGKLFYFSSSTLAQVGSLTTWTAVSGYSSSTSAYAYGIAEGKLYRLNDTTVTDLDISNCVAVYGVGISNYPALAVCSA